MIPLAQSQTLCTEFFLQYISSHIPSHHKASPGYQFLSRYPSSPSHLIPIAPPTKPKPSTYTANPSLTTPPAHLQHPTRDPAFVQPPLHTPPLHHQSMPRINLPKTKAWLHRSVTLTLLHSIHTSTCEATPLHRYGTAHTGDKPIMYKDA